MLGTDMHKKCIFSKQTKKGGNEAKRNRKSPPRLFHVKQHRDGL